MNRVANSIEALCILLVLVLFSSCNLTAGGGINTGAQVILYGEYNNEKFGSALDFIGDINSDGFQDIAVGAPANELLGENSGMVYIFFGPFDSSQERRPDMKISGFPGSNFGTSISGGFDINGDGISDFAVSSSLSQFGSQQNGDVFIYFGNAADFVSGENPVNGLELSGTVIYGADNIAGSLISRGFGSFIRKIGDFDRDGFTDLAVGAPSSDYLGTINSGAMFIFLAGRALSSSGRMDCSVADYIFVGEENGANLGFSFDYGLNLDGQGNSSESFSDDVIVGAPGSSKAYVFLGPSSRYTQGPVSSQFASGTYQGKSGDLNFGYSVTHLKDIDGDGFDDMAVSSKNENMDRVYLFYGSLAQAPLNNYSLILETQSASNTGSFIASFEGQGGNLSIGAPLGGQSGFSNGAVFFLLSEEFGDFPKYVETLFNMVNLNKIINNPMGLSSDSGYASIIQGSADVNNDGDQDLLVGSPLSDINGEDSGFAVLYF